MSRQAGAALDLGALTAKTAVIGAEGEPRFLQQPRADSQRATLAAALQAVPAHHHKCICLAIPDGWIGGGAAGGYAQEALRHIAEDELGLSRLTWTGQMAAVAALAAHSCGFTDSGRYLVCDVGAGGVRAATLEVSGTAMRLLAVDDVPGEGGRYLDGAVLEAVGAVTDPALGEWYLAAKEQGQRALTVLQAARAKPEFRDARAYRFTGGEGECELSAGQVMDCFRPVAERIAAAIATVLGTVKPAIAALAGGLTWFPLIQQAITDSAGVPVLNLGPHAAVHGALLIGRGDVQLAEASLPPITLPMHQVRNGLLEDVNTPLPWSWSFASGSPVDMEASVLSLEIAGQLRMARFPDLIPGPHRIGVRPAWSGDGLLVVRPNESDADPAVHVLPLSDLQPI